MKSPANIDPAVLELLSQAQTLIEQKRKAGTKKKPSPSKRPPVSLTDEELLKVLELARTRRTRDWVLMLVTYRHGLRASEALSIRRRDLEGGRLRIQRGKGSEFVDQPLCGHENPLLDEISAVGAWLAEMGEHGVKGAAKSGGRRSRAKTLQSSQNVKFHTGGPGHGPKSQTGPPDDRLFPFTRQRFFQLFRQYAIEAGLPPRKQSPHKLKHSLAKHLLRSNVPVNEVQDWLGWRSLRTADHYTRPDADEVAQSVDRALRSRPAFRQLRQSGLFEGKG